MKNLIVIACCVSVIFAKSFKKMHCGITCEPNLSHTMCAFTDVNTKCKELKITPTDEIKEEILLWHNAVRSEFLEGVHGSMFPPGTKIKKICWDKELAEMAKRWATQCEPVNDRCRKLPRFEVGQNVGVQIGLELPPSSLETFAEWTKPMDPEFSRSGEIGSSSNRRILERFFQVMSIDTYLIGCAETTYSRERFKHRLLVCNYGPAMKNDMDTVYSAAMEIRKARLMKSRRMEIEEIRLKQLSQRISSALYKGGSFTDSKRKFAIRNDGSDQRFEPKYGIVGDESGEDSKGSFSENYNKYCDINCNGVRHIMCPSNEDEPQPLTCELVKQIDYSFLRSCVTNKLNELRNLVAGGLASLPKASDMQILTWDEELARLAGKWARKCSKVPDGCRDVERFPVNQLVMVGVSTEGQDESHCFVMLDGVSRLTSMLDDNVIQSYSVSSVDYLQYLTQAIWARTSRVGCAEVLFRTEPNGGIKIVDQHSERFSSLVCNFGEGGNLLNQKVFKPGPPCSQCPGVTSCSNSLYPNLCVGDTPYTPRGIPSVARGLDDDSGLMETPSVYCEINCDGKQHIMCGPEVAPTSCNKALVLDEALVRKCVVASLNDLRNKVAGGNFSLPTASNMRMLIWDRELADLARRWALQCPEGTDECRDVVRFPVNQIVMKHVSSELHDQFHCPNMMVAITKLLPMLNASILLNYSINDTINDPLRYVTQSIWAKSSRVGCAEVRFFQGWGIGDYQMPDDFDDHTSQHASLVCNFGEGGNQMKQTVYRPGRPCSQCPAGTSCASSQTPEYAPYPNLCVEVNPL